MSDNATRFLNSFVRIEMMLKKQLGLSNERFSTMLHLASKTNPYLREKRQFLEEMAQLRNAIVHTRIGANDEVIAQPHDTVVEEIELIATRLAKPPKLEDLVSKRVLTVRPNDTVRYVLDRQNETGYSVIPVYEDKRYIGCVHPRLFMSYIQTLKSPIDLSELMVSDLLSAWKADQRIVFLALSNTVYDVLEVYESLHNKGKSLIAIVVTRNGHQNEIPELILTQADLPRLFVELE